LSRSSSALAVALAGESGRAILCERHRDRRSQLAARFPSALVLADHAEAIHHLGGLQYALVLSDPCGPAGHGVEHLEAISREIRSDFVIVCNLKFIHRFCRSDAPNLAQHRRNFGWMDDPKAWRERLGRRFVSATPVRYGSKNFMFQVLVVANYLTTPARTKPFEEIL